MVVDEKKNTKTPHVKTGRAADGKTACKLKK